GYDREAGGVGIRIAGTPISEKTGVSTIIWCDQTVKDARDATQLLHPLLSAPVRWLRCFGGQRVQKRSVAWVILVAGIAVLAFSFLGAFADVHVGGGPDGWCLKGSVHPPLDFGAPHVEQTTATGEPSVLPLGLVCTFLAEDGTTVVVTTSWVWTVLAAAGVLLITLATVSCFRTRRA
ncbi:MAG: hypothetical protein WA006_05945, partial [Rhodoglobus sp.]